MEGQGSRLELRELLAGRYVVEAVEEEAPALSPEEEAGGIEAALNSYCQGSVVDAKRAYEIIDAALGRCSSPTTDEAIADIVVAITNLNERNPQAATNLDAEIAQCIERQAAQEFDGQVFGYDPALLCGVGRLASPNPLAAAS